MIQKKLSLFLGTASTTIIPVTSIIACGNFEDQEISNELLRLIPLEIELKNFPQATALQTIKKEQNSNIKVYIDSSKNIKTNSKILQGVLKAIPNFDSKLKKMLSKYKNLNNNIDKTYWSFRVNKNYDKHTNTMFLTVGAITEYDKTIVSVSSVVLLKFN